MFIDGSDFISDFNKTYSMGIYRTDPDTELSNGPTSFNCQYATVLVLPRNYDNNANTMIVISDGGMATRTQRNKGSWNSWVEYQSK